MATGAVADVRLFGKHVGWLSYNRGRSSFQYEDDLTAPGHRVLGQVFEDDPRKVHRAPVGLPAWFGAVTVHGDEEPEDTDDPTAEDTPISPTDQPLRYSLAGVQLKYSVHSSRLTVPVSGKGQWWIVKLPDRGLPDLAANEYITMRWLSAAGLDVPPIDLLPASRVSGLPTGFVRPDDLVYLIERFDRTHDGSVHYEDFAQVADVEPRYKYGEFGASYDNLGLVIKHLTGPGGFDAYVRRLSAMVITGNTDAHLKNWALWYPDSRTPKLAPIYDFHSLTVYTNFRYDHWP